MELTNIIHQLKLEEWKAMYALWKMELFRTQWWVVLINIIFSYIVWWKFTDKNRLTTLLLFGSFVSVMRIIFDALVMQMDLYSYKVNLLPISGSLSLNDLTIVPLGYMLVYQFSPTWKSFFVWGAVWSAMWSFILKPLYAYWGILTINDWKFYYTFIATFLFGVFSRLALHLVMKVEQGRPIWRSATWETSDMLQTAMKPLPQQKEGKENKDDRYK